MLKRIYDILCQGNTISVEGLSEQLSISSETVKAELEYLEHIGMIRQIPMVLHCNGGCKNCMGCSKSDCNSMPILWELVNIK